MLLSSEHYLRESDDKNKHPSIKIFYSVRIIFQGLFKCLHGSNKIKIKIPVLLIAHHWEKGKE